MSAQIRIALVAPSGSGKSTTAALMRAAFEHHGRRVDIHKLALPLYELQASVYRACGVELGAERQDPLLLEALASHMRRIDPRALVRHFEQRLRGSQADVVLNDDLRDDATDWPWLRAAGFEVLRVEAAPALRQQRQGRRGDLSQVPNSPLDAQLARIEAQATLPNHGTLAQLQALVEDWVARRLQSPPAPPALRAAEAR